jgi:hypothetical protein
MSSKFQEILKDNEVIHQPNILDDHHALGLIDNFALTLNKTLTRLILQNNSGNWIDSIDEIVDNHNDTKHVGINDIRPKDAFLEKNHRTIYDINYEKSFYNNVKSDIDVDDKVRIKLTGKFRKDTDTRYTDEVYTVTKVRGNTVTLNNDDVQKKTSLFIVPKTTKTDGKNVIVKVNKENKIDKNLKSEGVDLVNILENTSKRNKLLDSLS